MIVGGHKADPARVKALARAFRYQKLLDEGRYDSISEMAAGQRIEWGYLGTLLRLTLPALLEGVPLGWSHQREHLLSGAPTRLTKQEVRVEA